MKEIMKARGIEIEEEKKEEEEEAQGGEEEWAVEQGSEVPETTAVDQEV